MKALNTILIFIFVSILLYANTSLEDVEKNLICTCGSNMVLNTCQCGTADKMRTEIKSMINKGMNKDQIIAAFVGQYGESVLAAPKKSGFDLTAWITPFFAIGLVGGLLFVAIKKWSGKNNYVPVVSDDIKSEYAQKLKDELDKFDEGDYL